MLNQQKIDEEAARAVQKLLSIPNEQTETVDDNIYLNCNEIVHQAAIRECSPQNSANMP